MVATLAKMATEMLGMKGDEEAAEGKRLAILPWA